MAQHSRRPLRLALVTALTVSLALVAQAPVGSLRLEVRDSSGAAVAAGGLLESLTTGFRRSFQCDERGGYTVSGLPIGRYRLRIAKDGFTTSTEVIEISSASPLTRAVSLTIGPSSYAVSVVSTTPLAGLDRPLDEIPSPAQTATDRDIRNSGALDVPDFLNRRLSNVYLNEIQGNPMQPDLNYRGYTASPLLGTPQGVSVYMDGVRLNQPFGDVVSWDLIPRVAVAEMAMLAGSDPLFGLNTLGGALSLRTKDGISHPGTSIQLSGGSFGRKMADIEHGGSTAKGLNWYLASSLFFEDGWRESSPSNVRQFLGKIGWQRERTSVGLTLAYANNALIGNGLQEQRLLERDYGSVYTKPDQTANRSPFVNLQLRHSFSNVVTFSGNAYFRHIRSRTMNGDINEDSLDQSIYQPSAAERAALTAAGYSGFPASGATAQNTPFPSWRCIANVLLNDEPGEKCNGLINATASQQRNYGVSGQVSWMGRIGSNRNQLTAGAAYDGNSVGFHQSTELGYLAPDRSVIGTGAYADGVTGGDVDGEPLDNRVNLSGRIHSASLFATNTLTVADRLNLTFSGRFNRTTIDNKDQLVPLAGSGSLTGKHDFSRFNPAIGATYRVAGPVSIYGGFTQGNRAPTSIELGCADPATPCKLPNSMAGDPPLKQVVTGTFEAGLRGGGEHGFRWSAGWFRATNHDDILFVASEQTGFGYFKNFDTTRRQGLELDGSARVGRVTVGGGYTFLHATFESTEIVNGSGNSSNDLARTVSPGLEGPIEIQPGSHIPLIPSHLVKAYADVQVTSKLLVDVGVAGVSSSYARGNENNQHQPDGTYYVGPGRSPGYGVVNLGARYSVHRLVELFVQVNNLFDRRYYSGAQLGPSGFTPEGSFVARPFPAASNGEYPVRQSTFYAPGAPRGAWVGLRFRF
ncbi:TonB-dependent receptor [uncultured Paludibaculum sp.]|uniref:TonB-dependent receptor n=1 Tax=uncultured Paludibaculum sp. TaxID=1765020 RepID=UPI002AAC10FD|nr:TonB-dependent receptor [uncultured Paludibaculum sp.]